MQNIIKAMNRNFIHAAKKMIREIITESETLDKGEILILQETGTGCTLKKVIEQKAMIDQDGIVIDQDQVIKLGSGPLKQSQVKNILSEIEYLEYL